MLTVFYIMQQRFDLFNQKSFDLISQSPFQKHFCRLKTNVNATIIAFIFFSMDIKVQQGTITILFYPFVQTLMKWTLVKHFWQ